MVVHPIGIEPVSTAPEAVALSVELRMHIYRTFIII